MRGIEKRLSLGDCHRLIDKEGEGLSAIFGDAYEIVFKFPLNVGECRQCRRKVCRGDPSQVVLLTTDILEPIGPP
jgi:hypothetical protein